MNARQAANRVKAMPPEDVNVELWLTCWTVFFPRERSAATHEHDEQMLQPFIRAHGRKLLSAVTPLMAQQWAVSNPSQLRYLRLAWEKAVLMQIVPFNVWKCVELPRSSKPPPRPVPTLAELDAALERARAKGGWWLEYADMVEATAFTGARQGGMVTLRRSAVDLEARRMVLTEKGGKTRRVVLTGRSLDAMTRALERRRHYVASPLVFLNSAGGQLSRHTVATAWRAIRGDFAGPFHSLKHFGGTWLAAHGVDELDIAIQLGHTDKMGRPYPDLVRRVYVHPDHDKALERIERQLQRGDDDAPEHRGDPAALRLRAPAGAAAGHQPPVRETGGGDGRDPGGAGADGRAPQAA